VRVAGAGHSFSDIALSEGLLLKLDRLGAVLDIDRSAGLVRVQAGITLRELSRQLAVEGLALENLGDIDAQSVAGAISTATHGTGARLPNLSAQVIELTLTEFRMVSRLAMKPGEDVSYRELYDLVHGKDFEAGYGTDGYRTNVRTFIKRIRKKFRSIDDGFRCIENYASHGYRWRLA